MQSMLLKRFESSWFAARETAKRMLNAVTVIIASIETHGVVPIGDIVNDLRIDADEGLVLQDELLETIDGESRFIDADQFTDDFLKHLQLDFDLLQSIESRLSALEGQYDPKLATLKRVMASTPSKKMAIFSTFGDTVRYLVQQIENDDSIIAGKSWISVVGVDTDPDQRTRAVERFCPTSESEQTFARADRDNDEVDVLISTDVLSEGQNLQQAGKPSCHTTCHGTRNG